MVRPDAVLEAPVGPLFLYSIFSVRTSIPSGSPSDGVAYTVECPEDAKRRTCRFKPVHEGQAGTLSVVVGSVMGRTYQSRRRRES